VKGNIEIVPTLGANIHVLVFTHTYTYLIFARFIHLVHTFDFVVKLNMRNSRHGIRVVQMGNLMNKKQPMLKGKHKGWREKQHKRLPKKT
jgi:hypothetical protein